MLKKILYLGWLGHANVGDEILFEIFKKMIYKEALKTNITLIVDWHFQLEKYEVDLTQYDMVVLGGGSLFSSTLEDICLKANGYNIPLVIWGTGFDKRDKNLVSTIVKCFEENNEFLCNPRTRIMTKCASLVGVRGNIEKHIIADDKINVIGDPAIIFNLLDNKYPEIKEVASFIKNSDEAILINWGTSYNNIIGYNEEKVQSELKIVISELLSKGYKVVVYPIWKDDIDACRSLISEMDSPNLLLIDKVYDAYGLANIIEKCKFSINFKLHANIISMAMKKPFISLAYGLKCYNFAESIDSKDLILFTDEVNEDKLLEKIEYIEENYSYIQKRFEQYIDIYYKKQIDFMSKIVNYIKENSTKDHEASLYSTTSALKKKLVLTTLFPPIENSHLIKDVGMIPYIMKKYHGYDGKIAGYAKGEFPYLNKETKGLKIDKIEDTGNLQNDVYKYLARNAKDIDILHVFHPEYATLEWIALYKSLNPNGKVYLKLDANVNVKDWNYTTVFNDVQRKIFKNCDLISVETIDLYKFLNKNWPLKVEYIPNGFYAEDYENTLDLQYTEKENIVITVGRIGSYAKATEILMQAFAKSSNELNDWTLKIIGPIEEHFKQYIQQFFIENPNLINKVIFTGEITDREILSNEYRKAKIFCLPSRWESFGIVLAEAIQHGCYIIGSNILSINDITDNKKYGDVFEIDDVDQLSRCFIKACGNEEELKRVCAQAQDYAYEKFNWVRICSKIDQTLRKSCDI